MILPKLGVLVLASDSARNVELASSRVEVERFDPDGEIEVDPM